MPQDEPAGAFEQVFTVVLMDKSLEYLGSGFSLAGAYLLAGGSAWGWWAFLLANVLLVGFALRRRHYGLMAMYMAFIPSSLIGLFQ